MSDEMVKVQILVSKVQDGETLHRKGEIVIVGAEWAKARGTSVRILTPPTTPSYIEPEEETVEETIIIEEPQEADEDVQRKGERQAPKKVTPVKKPAGKKR